MPHCPACCACGAPQIWALPDCPAHPGCRRPSEWAPTSSLPASASWRLSPWSSSLAWTCCGEHAFSQGIKAAVSLVDLGYVTEAISLSRCQGAAVNLTASGYLIEAGAQPGFPWACCREPSISPPLHLRKCPAEVAKCWTVRLQSTVCGDPFSSNHAAWLIVRVAAHLHWAVCVRSLHTCKGTLTATLSPPNCPSQQQACSLVATPPC